jgi:hypothetical protein
LARAQEEEIRRLQQQLCDLLKLPDDSEAPELNALKKEIEVLIFFSFNGIIVR